MEELKRTITTEWRKTVTTFKFIDNDNLFTVIAVVTIALTSGVVVLNVLLRITVDINNVISLKESHVLSFSYFSYSLSLTVDH